MADYAVLREINLTVGKVLSHRASNSKLDELGRQKRRSKKELAMKDEKLEKELEAATKTSTRLKEAVRGSLRSQSTKSRTAQRGSSSGRREARSRLADRS